MNNISTTTCEVIGSSTQCRSELPESYANGFSYGDIMIVTVLFIIMCIQFFTLFIQKNNDF